jgi:inosose dehydratase
LTALEGLGLDAPVTTSLPVDRIAGAPISWGLCEVPGWGHQLPPARVLSEMQALGLVATEFGPPGFLEADPESRVAQLADHGLAAVGGFHVAVLHDPAHDPLPGLDAFIDECLAAGAGMVVVAAGTGRDGYDARPELDEAGWQTLLTHLDRISDHAASRGVEACLHPHMGTMVESGAETQRVLDGSRIGLCVDTGHLAAAGADPTAIVAANPLRVRHVHLKDVDSALAAQVVARSLPFGDAVRAGLFVPLGAGAVDVHGIVDALEGAGYQGWYVLEQDVMLPGDPDGEGPVADVRACLSFLTGGAP